uniref:Protein EFR3 n=1 Tax=Caenorhabditis tropicalis TaxID=1561998 RepID=A0A1I7U0H7_9PELO
MTSTVLAQITDELSTNLSSDRELHLLKSAHRIIDKNLTVNALTDKNDTYYRYLHRMMAITFGSLEKKSADVRLAAEEYYEHILKAYECYGFPETSFRVLALSIDKMTGARQVTKVMKYVVYYLDILPKQRLQERNGRTFYQDVIRKLLLKSLDINETICHQSLEKSCDRLISAVEWNTNDLRGIADKTRSKMWSTRGHASRTMAALLGAIMIESKETFPTDFNAHVEKVIETFVNNQNVPVGAISLIKKCLTLYSNDVSLDNMKGLIEMLILMIRDSSNEVAYDAFAALEELMKCDIDQLEGFVPGRFLRTTYGSTSSEPEEPSCSTEFVDPLVNADLYEQLQETKPPPKVDLHLEDFEKLATDSKPSVINYVTAFLGKSFLLTGHGKLLKTDRQSKDSMKILAIRVLNVISNRIRVDTFSVRIGEKTQCLVDIIDYSTSSDDQLCQQAIKFMFLILRHRTDLEDCLDIFKSVKKYRYLLDAVTTEHLITLRGTQLLEYLEIMASRPLLTTKYDLSIPDITNACGFIGVVRNGLVQNKLKDERMVEMVERFQNCLKRCIIDCWDTPRFVNAVPTLFGFNSGNVISEDSYPCSVPLRLKLLSGKRSKQNSHCLQQNLYDDWRTCLISEALMPTIVKMSAILRESLASPEYCHEKVAQISRMHWNSDTLPAVLQVMAVSLTDSPSKEECYHGFHVGMAVLNWIYRNVYNERGAAETKEFPFLQHSRTEMDDALGNRNEFGATLKAYYTTVQSSADEKLDQLLTPTMNLMMAAMATNFRTSTENVLEIIIYIKVLFTISPISALKLLHSLLRCLLDPKLVDTLTRGRVFYFESSNTKAFNNDDEFLIEALKCKGDKYFNRWGDDMDVERVNLGFMTSEILGQLEPLITQGLKCFRYRGLAEKEQVLQIMICLINHQLKLTDADPTQCLMKYTNEAFGQLEACPHPELFDTLMHFLATASRFEIERTYQKPVAVAIKLMSAVDKMPAENFSYVMKAVSFALLNGRFETDETDGFIKMSQSTWRLCMKNAPTETLFTLSLLLEKSDTAVKNQELFWSIFSEWINQKDVISRHVPFSAIALPLSLITEYLTSDDVKIFEIMDGWVKNNEEGNINGRSALIAALYFSANDKIKNWQKYVSYVIANGRESSGAEFLSKYADNSLFSDLDEELDFDEELDGINFTTVEGMLEKHLCGSFQDLCHTIVCLGEASVFDFIELIEKEYPNDDSIWGLLISEFRRLEDDLEHRLDITFRLQDLAEAMSERFNTDMYLKLLANIKDAGVNLNCLNITQIKFILDQVTLTCPEDGYVLRGVRNLLLHPRMYQLIMEDELGTAQLFVKLAEKVSGITITDALIASYSQYRVDFQVKGDMDERKVKEIKKFTLSVFALCQEANLRSPKHLSKSQAACFRHPVLNSIFNISLVAMKCFHWIPVVEIVRKPTITCLPPTGHVCDVLVLDDIRSRLSKVELVTNAQFEVLFTTMQAVIAHTVIGPEKDHHDDKDVLEREARSCNALQLYIATILNSMKYPNGGDPLSGFVLKSPYISELFLQSTEFAHLCNLKSVWKCEPRTAFTTPLERHNQKIWTHCDGKTTLYGICQTPLFALWQLCGMMPIEFKQHANYHRIDHSASNYFLTSATNIDTISNVKQLMNIFEYWYSQGIGELGEPLLYTILQTILHLSDFFDDPDLHKAVLRTTSIIYRHEYDQNPFLSSFVHIMFLKSISVLGADMNSPEFKPGEPESIAMKIVSSGLASDFKIIRVHTLAGLLYLVQSDTYESFMPAIDILSSCLEKYLKKLANGTGNLATDESQFVIALICKLLEVPIRLKQDKKTMLKLLLAAMRVRKERFIIELIGEGIEQLLCRSNEFNADVINFLLAGLESGDPIPFPTDNEYYCRIVYRILMVAATRAKVANDEASMTRIHKGLQKLGFDLLRRGETAPAIARTLPFFSICVNGVENTIDSYMDTFMNVDDKDIRFVTSLISQIVETAATSKKWSMELKTFRKEMQSKQESLDERNQWLFNLLCKKIIE